MAEKDEGDKESQPVIETAETERTVENLSASPRAETSRSRSSAADDKILSKESEEFESTKRDGRSLQILDEEENSKAQPSEKNGSTVETGKIEGEEGKEPAKETRASKAESLQQSKSLEPLGENRKVEFPGHSRRHCQRRFREMIGKRELRKEELGKLEGDLRQRLDMLECSMPAVMVWNVLRMAQSGMPLTSLHRTIEKQFQLQLAAKRTSSEAGTEASRHYDSRVRELEAKRKLAEKRAEEARAIWTEKQAVLEAKRRRLEEAKKIQQEVKKRIEELDEQARKLRSEAQKRHEQDQECTAG